VSPGFGRQSPGYNEDSRQHQMTERLQTKPGREVGETGLPWRRQGAAGVRSAVVLMAGIGVLGVVVAPLAGTAWQAIVCFGVAWIALLWSVVLLLATRTREEHRRLAFGADASAIVLLGAIVAASGDVDGRALAGLLAVPVVHAVAFQYPPRVAILAVAAFGVAAAALGLAGRPVGVVLAALGPTLVALVAASLTTARVREERDRATDEIVSTRRMADEDGLTGVGNYRAFWRALRAECARALRHGAPFSLAVIDLDDFKLVNDEHGHRAGDDALRAVADALREALRLEDVLCRQGGDEFAVVAIGVGGDEAPHLAARLRAAVARADVPSHVVWSPGASVGTATYGMAGIEPEVIMEAAESSLAAAKSARHGGAVGGTVPAVRPAGVGPGVADRRSPGGRPAARLTTLAGLAWALAAAHGERGLAETAVAHVAGAVDARSVAVVRRGATGVECLAAGGPPGLVPAAVTSAAREAPLSVALQEGQVAVWARGPGPGDAGPPGTALAAPVKAGEELWGAILVESEREAAYGPAEVALVEAMAAQLGRVLEVSRLITRLNEGGWDEARGSAAPIDDHGRDVAELATRVGDTLGLSADELRDLHVAGLFHEVGTVCAPAGLMEKRGHLTPEEFDVVRAHPLVGERLLGSVPGLAAAARIVRSERERYDGHGYPDGLAGERIPLASRILGACDAFVAMTSRRPYRPALSRGAAVEELRRGAGTQFDPEVVDALVNVLDTEPAPIRHSPV
jgi:diguanylate cyclase (GGDEF)-like protein